MPQIFSEITFAICALPLSEQAKEFGKCLRVARLTWKKRWPIFVGDSMCGWSTVEIDDFVALNALPGEHLKIALWPCRFLDFVAADTANNQKECANAIYVYVCITTSDCVTRGKKWRERKIANMKTLQWEAMRRKGERDTKIWNGKSEKFFSSYFAAALSLSPISIWTM